MPPNFPEKGETRMENNCEMGNHEYSEKECSSCGVIFCYSCCGYTNVANGGKYEQDSMTCPKCGHDYYED